MPPEQSVYDLTHRDVSEQSISKSFKGIIRIAHIKELIPGQTDMFCSNEYYGQPDELLDVSGINSEKGIGTPSAYQALSGNIERYSSLDEYKDRKVPVTTSLGEYLNYSIGTEGVTFGHYYENSSSSVSTITTTNNGGVSSSHPRFYPSLTSNLINVGLNDENDFIGGELNVENTTTTTSRLIIQNNSSQTTASGNPNTYGKDGTLNYRTIFSQYGSTITDNSVLMYQQENYDRENLTLGTYDANVSIVNLVDYVKDRLEVLINSDFVGVPTGSVMWQYVSLDKWYGGTYGKSIDENEKTPYYPGNQPPLAKIEDTTFEQQRIQNVSKDFNIISSKNARGLDGNSDGEEEAIPIYRRDYVLCDGSTYYFSLNPIKNDEAFDRFFNLFYVLGYEYTSPINMTTHGKYFIHKKEITVGGEKRVIKYRMSYNEQDELTDLSGFEKTTNKVRLDSFYELLDLVKMKDVAYAVDMATIQAFMLISSIKDSPEVTTNGIFDRDKAENYLKTKAKMDTRYPFTTPLKSARTLDEVSANETTSYEWTILDDKTFDDSLIDIFDKNKGTIEAYCRGKRYIGDDFYNGVELGREITSFSDPILFYYEEEQSEIKPNEEVAIKYVLKYKLCRVYQLPSVQRILEYFTPGYGGVSQKLWTDFFTFRFSVPNFNIKIDGKDEKIVGAFIAFSQEYSKNGITETYGNYPTLLDVPHRHTVFRGVTQFNNGGDWNGLQVRISTQPDSPPSSAVCWKLPTKDASFSGHDDSYAIFEVRANFNQSLPLLEPMTGVNGETDYYEKQAFRFTMGGSETSGGLDANRCPTSAPYTIGTGFEDGMSQKYDYGKNNMLTAGLPTDIFTPESSVMLPIIKL